MNAKVTISEYIKQLSWINGKTIAIVYTYEGDSISGAEKYDFWEGDVISDWVHGAYELRTMPFIIDARTFVEKSMNNTLPPIDFVVDLNDGYYDISSLALIPSVCAYKGLPCIPCNASLLLMGENKYISNILAKNFGFSLPKAFSKPTKESISRPFCYGSSCGVAKGVPCTETRKTEILIQEFVQGFDVTVPVLYCPTDDDMTVLPAVAYRPNNYDPQWFLGEQEKKEHSGYQKQLVSIDNKSKEMIKDFAKQIGVTTYCRIDFRCMCDTASKMKSILASGCNWNDLKFIEINPLPTIKENINFFNSLGNITPEHPIAQCLDAYYNKTRNATLTGFVLSCSIIASAKAKH